MPNLDPSLWQIANFMGQFPEIQPRKKSGSQGQWSRDYLEVKNHQLKGRGPLSLLWPCRREIAITLYLIYYVQPTLSHSRRCVQCSGAHCCNSWCKEEAVFIQMFLFLAVAQFITFLPILDSLAQKLDLNREALDMLSKIYYIGRPEVGRAIEMLASGLAIPILCYLWLPTYRYRWHIEL